MDKIVTRYDPPPIPPREFDWSAVTDSYEPGDPIGYGRTEEEAVADLKATLTVESWCEALESGKYKQAVGQLRAGSRFCCLGVACEIGGEGDWHGDEYYTASHGHGYGLPRSLCRSLNLSTVLGTFDFYSLPTELQAEILEFFGNGRPHDLSDLNDSGVPFPLIAKVIRARPKGLFREEAA